MTYTTPEMVTAGAGVGAGVVGAKVLGTAVLGAKVLGAAVLVGAKVGAFVRGGSNRIVMVSVSPGIPAGTTIVQGK